MDVANVRVNLRTDQVLKDLSRARVDTMLNLAEALVEATRSNIEENDQVDTGFMRASTYYVVQAPGLAHHSSYGETWADGEYMSRRRGKMELREKAPEETLIDGAMGLVCVGAVYADEQELKQSFLYKAAGDVNVEEIVSKL